MRKTSFIMFWLGFSLAVVGWVTIATPIGAILLSVGALLLGLSVPIYAEGTYQEHKQQKEKHHHELMLKLSTPQKPTAPEGIQKLPPRREG